MIESEAGGKRCCGPHPCGTVGNQGGEERYCVGSACMAWESWSNTARVHPDNKAGFEQNGWHATGTSSSAGLIDMVHPAWGDCGLKAKECNCGN